MSLPESPAATPPEPTPAPTEPPPLEWHKDLVAIDAEGYVYIRLTPDPLALCTRNTTKDWNDAAEAAWTVPRLQEQITHLKAWHEPAPIIAQMITKLNELATASGKDHAQAYAHASVLFQNALKLPK